MNVVNFQDIFDIEELRNIILTLIGYPEHFSLIYINAKWYRYIRDYSKRNGNILCHDIKYNYNDFCLHSKLLQEWYRKEIYYYCKCNNDFKNEKDNNFNYPLSGAFIITVILFGLYSHLK